MKRHSDRHNDRKIVIEREWTGRQEDRKKPTKDQIEEESWNLGERNIGAFRDFGGGSVAETKFEKVSAGKETSEMQMWPNSLVG